MAGRPRKMAATVAGFEEHAMVVAMEVFEAIPEPYREDLTADPVAGKSMDPLCAAWRRCVETTLRASIACEALGDMLRERAGITEPGPSARILAGAGDEVDPEEGPEITREGGER